MIDFIISDAAAEHTLGLENIPEAWDENSGYTAETVTDAYDAGALAMLEAISSLFREHKVTGESTKERDAFYMYYNIVHAGTQRITQTVTVGERRFQAEWEEDPFCNQSKFGSFWSSSSASLHSSGEWRNYASGPLRGNPQTEREAQLMLLQMASW